MQIYSRKKLQIIHSRLKRKKETLAVAESVTSGMVQLAVGQAEFASEFYQGGITAYNLGQKYRHLQVEPIAANACDCVSKQVAEEMALHVCELFNAQWGIAITGYATPIPESGNKIFAIYSIAYKGKTMSSSRLVSNLKDPFKVQASYTTRLLDALFNVLT